MLQKNWMNLLNADCDNTELHGYTYRDRLMFAYTDAVMLESRYNYLGWLGDTLNKDIKKMIRGKNLIGIGSRRDVYDLGNRYVLKVAKSKYGIISNKREVKIYRSSPSKLKKHLARIKKHGDSYQWLIMKKYRREFKKTKKNLRNFFKMVAKFRRNRIIPYDIFDRNGPNYLNVRLSRSGRRIVVIDYGDFKYRST